MDGSIFPFKSGLARKAWPDVPSTGPLAVIMLDHICPAKNPILLQLGLILSEYEEGGVSFASLLVVRTGVELAR
jgi:hypothetical protein